MGLGAKGEDLVPGDRRSRPTYRLAKGSSALKPRPNLIPDQGPLKLADGGHHVEDQLAGRRGRVDVLLDRDEGGAAAAQVFERLGELLDGAGGPVEALDDD